MENNISREEKFGITREVILDSFMYHDGKLIRIKGEPRYIGKWDWSLRGRMGYRHLVINKEKFGVHRLIWIIFNGFIPVDKHIDHIDRDTLNNRIENLRLVSIRENNMNRKDNNSFPGVYYSSKRKKFHSQISIGGINKHLGRYETLEEAVEARRNAERELGIEVREEFFRAS